MGVDPQTASRVPGRRLATFRTRPGLYDPSVSTIPITHLHVDALVQAGLVGPLEATDWRSLVEDPDELGRKLFKPPKSGKNEYAFRPLPIQLTAIEVVKACDFFTYNSRSNSYITALRGQAIGWVPGYNEAPWGWQDQDIIDRAERPAPPLPLAADPRVIEMVERFAAAGIRMEASEQIPRELLNAFDPRDRQPIVAFGYAHPFGTSGFAPLTAILAADEKSAEKAWFYAIGRSADPIGQTKTRQWGNLVVFTKFLPHQADAHARLEQVLASWPDPSRTWSNNDEPRQVVHRPQVNRRVELRGLYQSGQTFVARTSDDHVRLVGRIKDPELRSKLADLDPERHSLIVVAGSDEIGTIEALELIDAANPRDYPPLPLTELEIRAIRPADPSTFATLIICELLETAPKLVRTLQPDVARFTGQWRVVEAP